MDAIREDRELAKTMIILAGKGAYDAAVRFASDCRARGNEVLAELWERVVASIAALTRVAEPVVAAEVAPAPKEQRPRLGPKCRFEHLPYDHAARAAMDQRRPSQPGT